ncbi:MAG: ABC transporter permease [Vicinamibacterales bacterium]
MRSLHRLRVLVRGWLRSDRMDQEFREELEFHIEREAESNLRAGMPPSQALREARLAVGHVEALREDSRDDRHGEFARQVLRDVAYGWRLLRKAPGFTLSAVLVLALGIGATTAIFSLVDAALLRPLPFANANRLVKLFELTPDHTRSRVSLNNLQDWAEQSHTLAAIAGAGYSGTSTIANGTGPAETVATLSVTAPFFDVLGVRPVAGRNFAPDEIDESLVVMISERIWHAVFDGSQSAVGRTVSIGGGPSLTVVGIVPNSFELLNKADVWTLLPRAQTVESRRLHSFDVIARVKPGVTLDQVRADMANVADGIARAWPQTNKDWAVSVEPLQQAIISDELRSTALVLLGGVLFILVMVCANVANLLLAKGVGRTRELGVRSALGAAPGRLVRQLLTESLVLSILGGTLGIVLARFLIRAAPSFLPAGTIPLSVTLHVDWRLMAFAVAATALTALVAGIVPAWHATRVSLVDVMGSGARTLSGGHSTRAGLAVVQIAAALFLVTGAGLFLRTIQALNRVDTGYHADRVLTMGMSLPLFRYPSPDSRLTFYESVQRDVEALPGVRSAAFINGDLPLDGFGIGQTFQVEGEPVTDAARQPVAHYQMITPSYLNTLGIALVQGTGFAPADTGTSIPVCIVNEAFVRRYLPGRDPLRTRITIRTLSTRTSEIQSVSRAVVGVVRQVRVRPDETEPEVELYVPLAQNPWIGGKLVVRAEGDPTSLMPSIRAVVSRIDKDMAITRIRTMEEVTAEATASPRFRAQLVGAFAVLAVAIAGIGLYRRPQFSGPAAHA